MLAVEAPRKKVGLRSAEIVVTAVFAILPMLPFVPVEWKVFLGFLAWGGLWHLLSTEVECFQAISKKVFFGRVGVITLFIFIGLWTTIVSAWKYEQASIMSGELEADSSGNPHTPPILQVGPDPDGTKLNLEVPNGAPWLTIWGDEFVVRKEQGKILVTTHVRDRNGSSVVVDVTDNKWTVSSDQSISWDKNYTKNALEVKDGRDRIIFQIILLPDAVRVQGEWWTEDRHGMRLVRPYPFDRKRTGPVFRAMSSGTYFPEPHIEPIFKYPSRDHWGEFVNWFTLQP